MTLGRRALLQVAAAMAALGGAGRRAAAPADAGRPAALQGDRPGHAAQLHRPACAARAALFPRAVGQYRRRQRSRAAAAYRRREAAGGLQGRPRQRRCLCARLHRLRGSRAHLRPARRARPAVDPDQGDPRRARRQGAAARRRRHLAGQLQRAADQGRRHGEDHERAQARRHDRALGIHLRRRRA